jgi:hypothetical protein
LGTLPAGVRGTRTHTESARHAHQCAPCTSGGFFAGPYTPARCPCLVHCCMQEALVHFETGSATAAQTHRPIIPLCLQIYSNMPACRVQLAPEM